MPVLDANSCLRRSVTLWFPTLEEAEQLAIAEGTFASRYADPNVLPGQGNWVQVFERDGDAWRETHPVPDSAGSRGREGGRVTKGCDQVYRMCLPLQHVECISFSWQIPLQS